MTARLAASLRFVRARLFATPLDAAITLTCCWLIARVIGPLINWPILDATFRGATRADCSGAGACWVFIRARFGQFMYGFYPLDQRWRVHLVGGARAVVRVVDIHGVHAHGLVPAKVVKAPVASDPVQPRPDLDRALVGQDGVEGGRHDLLEDVLGVLSGSQ